MRGAGVRGGGVGEGGMRGERGWVMPKGEAGKKKRRLAKRSGRAGDVGALAPSSLRLRVRIHPPNHPGCCLSLCVSAFGFFLSFVLSIGFSKAGAHREEEGAAKDQQAEDVSAAALAARLEDLWRKEEASFISDRVPTSPPMSQQSMCVCVAPTPHLLAAVMAQARGAPREGREGARGEGRKCAANLPPSFPPQDAQSTCSFLSPAQQPPQSPMMLFWGMVGAKGKVRESFGINEVPLHFITLL